MHLSLRFFFSLFLIGIGPGTVLVSALEQNTAPTDAPALGLGQFIEIALINNPGVDEARSQIWAAEGRSTQITSAYFPQLSASGQAARVHVYDLHPTDEGNLLAGTLSADQLLFDFGKTTGAIAAADSKVESARAYLNSVGSNLVYSVKESYYICSFEILSDTGCKGTS